jgi:hypothetical protein
MSTCVPNDEAKRLIRAMARNRSDAGMDDPIDIVNSIHAEIKDHTPLWKSEIADIVSGYGKKSVPTKDELRIRWNALRAQMRDMSRTQDALQGKGPFWTAKNRARVTGLENEIADLTRQIDSLTVNKGTKEAVTSPEIVALKERRDALKQQVENLKPSPPPIYPKDPNEAKNKSRATALEKEIKDINRRIAQRDFNKPEGGVPLKYTEETQRLIAERDALKKQMEQVTPAPPAVLPKDPNEARQKAIGKQMERTRTEMAQIKADLAAGNYSKPTPKAKRVYNDETFKLQAQRDKLALQKERLMNQGEYENQSWAARAAQRFLAFRRAAMLSSLTVFEKLTGAALSRFVTTPAEEAVGSLLRLVPGIKQIAAKAPRHGAGAGPALGEAFKAAFSKNALSQSKQKLLTGKNDLDLVYGRKDVEHHFPLLELFGNAHGAFKTPVQIFEFVHSLALRAKHERDQMIAKGMSAEDADAHMASPVTKAMIEGKAYADSMRAILMGDNKATRFVRAITTWLRQAKSGGAAGNAASNAAAFAIDYELPIINVPTNIVSEIGSLSLGGLASAMQVREVANAVSKLSKDQQETLGLRMLAAKTIEAMTPDQADYFMRNAKKQVIGLPLLYLGYVLASGIGGFYQTGDNKKKGIQEAGTAKVGDTMIPKALLHSPTLDMLQAGATIKHVEDSKRGGNVGAGALAAAEGVVGEVPFFDAPARLVTALKSDTMGQYLGNQVAGNVPAIVRQTAKAFDKADKRYPQTFTQEIEQNIPGLRQNVPSEKPKRAFQRRSP